MTLNRKRTVSIEPIGGLGNQLFILSAGLWLAKKFDVELIVDMARGKVTGHQHGSSIEGFIEGVKFRNLGRSNFEVKLTGLIDRMSRRNDAISNLRQLLGGSYCSRQIGYDPRIELLSSPRAITGYFQTYRYVEDLDIVNKIKIKSPTEWLQNQLKEISSDGFVAMHIRRGDYEKVSDLYGLLDTNYYVRAIKSIPVPYQNLPIWVFSDDPKQSETITSLIKGKKFKIVSPPPESEAFESLFLMSKARVNLIANSTFSWWGAYLSNHHTVIAPETWYKGMEEPMDLIPKSWIRVLSSWV